MNTLNAESPAIPAEGSPPVPPKAAHTQKGLIVIGIFKLLKGTALLAVGLGLLSMLHRDVQEYATDLIERMRFDPDNRHIATLLGALGLIDDHRLKEFSGLSSIYAALFLTEGIGLLRRKRWAEYLTVVATSSLIPVEIYEVWLRVTPLRICFFLGNIAILVYLIAIIRKNKEPHSNGTPAA